MVDCSLVTTVLFTMVTGLLFIDLVSLQENMVCSGDYTNANTCPEVFFAQGYHAARTKFREAAKKAKAELKQHIVVEEDGFQYTIDTAFLRGKNSERLLVHMSGAGGVDGYTGSALQVKLLREWNNTREEGPSVLFVHAVNPYGMAHFRRSNENNVILDHNCLSAEEWGRVKARDSNVSLTSEASAFFSLSRGPRLLDRYVFFYHLAQLLATRGLATLRRVLSSGQHHRPDGFDFGGRGEQRGVTLLREIIEAHTAAPVRKFVVLDVRSGHGSEGAETFATGPREEDKALVKSIFGTSVAQSTDVNSLSANLLKLTGLSGKEGLVIREEFGTVGLTFVVRAVFLENAAYNYARGTHVHSVMQEWMRDAFYPQTIKYKRAVLKKGVNAFNSAWKHLS